MIIIVDAMQVDEMPSRRFVEMARSTDPDRHGLNVAHAGFASNGYRMHISTEEGHECSCGDEMLHNRLNESVERATSGANFSFAINRQLLLEALAGIPGDEYTGIIHFYFSAKDRPVVVTSPDMTRAAIIMPMTTEEKPLELPRITEPPKAAEL